MTPSRGAFSLALYLLSLALYLLFDWWRYTASGDRAARGSPSVPARYLAWKEPKCPIVIADCRARLRARRKSSRNRRPQLDLLKIRHTSGVTREGRKKVKRPAAGCVICQKPLPRKKFLRPWRPKNFAINPLWPKVNIALNRM
jgi:hypothetical protein